MRCGCFVLNDRTPKGRKRTKVTSWWHTADLGPHAAGVTSESLLAEGYVRCEGTINVKVTAEDEPYYGGCSAVFSIDYRCDTCDWMFYPHLPQNSEALSSMVTTLVGEMSEGTEKSMIAAARDAERAKIEHRNKMMADFHSRQANMKAKTAKKKVRS